MWSAEVLHHLAELLGLGRTYRAKYTSNSPIVVLVRAHPARHDPHAISPGVLEVDDVCLKVRIKAGTGTTTR